MDLNSKSFFVVTKKETYQELVSESKSIGLLYPMPHYYLYKFEMSNDSEDIKIERGRPLHSPMALARHSNSSIGIVIYTTDGRISNEMYNEVSRLISSISQEFCDNCSVEIFTDKKYSYSDIDTARLLALVSKSKNIFQRLK